MIRRTLAVLVAAVALPQDPPAVKAEPSAPRAAADAKAAKPPFVLEAGALDVPTLIARCGSYLQRNVLLHERELFAGRGQQKQTRDDAIVLDLPIVTDTQGCEDLLHALLWSHGLVVVPIDADKALYEVLSVYGSRSGDILARAIPRTTAEILARPALHQYVSTIVTLQHLDGVAVAHAANSWHPNGATRPLLAFTPMGQTKAVGISGPQFVVAQLLRTIQAMDVAPSARERDLEQRITELTSRLGKVVERLQALEGRASQPR